MSVSKRAPTMPVEALGGIVGSPVPGLEGVLIAREVMAHIGVDPKLNKGSIEMEDGRPMRGQDHEIDVRRSYNQPYPEVYDSDPTWIEYKTQQLAPAVQQELDWIEDNKGLAGVGPYMQRMLRIARRTLLLKEEQLAAAFLFNATTWGANTSSLVALPGGSGAKFTAAGAEEFSDLAIGAELAADTFGGVSPTDLTIGLDGFRKLRRSTENRTYGATTKNRTSMPDDELIQMIIEATGVQRLHVGRARHETAISGAASVEADIWTDSALFHWRDVDASPGNNGVSTQGGTALGIYLNRRGAVNGYWGKQVMKEDPDRAKMVAGLDIAYKFLQETDSSTGTLRDPRGFLITDLV